MIAPATRGVCSLSLIHIWALRNIAYIYRLEQNIPLSLACYERLFKLSAAFADQGFAEEYLSLLISQRQYRAAWDFFKTLPEVLRHKDRIALLSGSAAVEVGELDYVEQLLTREFAVIREGENSTSDILKSISAGGSKLPRTSSSRAGVYATPRSFATSRAL